MKWPDKYSIDSLWNSVDSNEMASSWLLISNLSLLTLSKPLKMVFIMEYKSR